MPSSASDPSLHCANVLPCNRAKPVKRNRAKQVKKKTHHPRQRDKARRKPLTCSALLAYIASPSPGPLSYSANPASAYWAVSSPSSAARLSQGVSREEHAEEEEENQTMRDSLSPEKTSTWTQREDLYICKTETASKSD